MTNPSPRPPDAPPAVRGRRNPRGRLVAAALLLPVVLSACSLRIGKDFQYNVEAGYRHNVVVSRDYSIGMAWLLDHKGQAETAAIVAKVVRSIWEIDRIYCPAGGIPGCDTVSEYTRGHSSDLAGAIRDARGSRTCVALTVLPPYNYTSKGRSHGCIG